MVHILPSNSHTENFQLPIFPKLSQQDILNMQMWWHTLTHVLFLNQPLKVSSGCLFYSSSCNPQSDIKQIFLFNLCMKLSVSLCPFICKDMWFSLHFVTFPCAWRRHCVNENILYVLHTTHKCLLSHLSYMPSLEHVFECVHHSIFKPIHVVSNFFLSASVQKQEGCSLKVLEMHLRGKWNCDWEQEWEPC